MTPERGVALIVALLFLSFLTILGGALLSTSTIDVWISDNYKTSTESLYLAEAGIEQARELVRSSGNATSQLLSAAAGYDGVLSTSTDPAALLSGDDRPLIPASPMLRSAGQPLVDPSGRLIGRYHVWLRNDNADGMSTTADTNQVLTLLSVGRIGKSKRIMELTIRQAGFPRIPAVLMLDGPVDVFNSTNSTFFEVNGNDQGSADEQANAIGVTEQGGVTKITAELTRSPDRTANYKGSGGVTPAVANVEFELDPLLKTVAGLESLVTSISRNATETYNPAYGSVQAIGDYGDPANYRIAVVNGDVNLGPGAGYGVLVVRGNFNVAGNFTWNGLILVIGQGVLHWNSDYIGSIDGGLFLARTRANDRNSSNIAGTLLSLRGGITADFDRAAGSGIHYNTSSIVASNRVFPFMPIAVKER